MSALNHHTEADGVDKAMDHMKIEQMDVNATPNAVTTTQHTDLSQIPPQLTTKSESLSHNPKAKLSESPKMEAFKQEEVIGGQITLLQEPGEPPKLSRKASQRVISRPPLLYNDLPDATEEATQSFQVIRDCIYGSKYMGAADQDAYGCDCSEEWRKSSYPYLSDCPLT
jgi:histone-lysine N-methyltransferase SETD2